MKNFIHSLAIVLALLPGLFSCSVLDSEVTVNDLSFELRPEIVWNAEYMAYTLRVSLAAGEEGEYQMSYSIDDDPLLQLGTAAGGAAISGGVVSLSRRGGAVFVLPELSVGRRHEIVMEFTREGVKRTCTLDLPDTHQRAVGVRVDTDDKLEFTRVILTNLMGASVTNYTVTFSLDGESLEGIKYMSSTFGGTMQIDFARSESYTFELPYLATGEHFLKVDVQSTLGSESTTVTFVEPQRKQTSLEFSYNPYTGNLMVASSYNPAKTSFSFTLDVTVKGSVTYRHEQFFGVAAPATEYFTETGESVITLTPGLLAASVDGGLVKKLLDKVFANARNDSAAAIGLGNARTVFSDINSVSLDFKIHSMGSFAGKTAVTVSPQTGSLLPISYTYPGTTWNHAEGYVNNIVPSFKINGTAPSKVKIL